MWKVKQCDKPYNVLNTIANFICVFLCFCLIFMTSCKNPGKEQEHKFNDFTVGMSMPSSIDYQDKGSVQYQPQSSFIDEHNDPTGVSFSWLLSQNSCDSLTIDPTNGIVSLAFPTPLGDYSFKVSETVKKDNYFDKTEESSEIDFTISKGSFGNGIEIDVIPTITLYTDDLSSNYTYTAALVNIPPTMPTQYSTNWAISGDSDTEVKDHLSFTNAGQTTVGLVLDPRTFTINTYFYAIEATLSNDNYDTKKVISDVLKIIVKHHLFGTVRLINSDGDDPTYHIHVDDDHPMAFVNWWIYIEADNLPTDINTITVTWNLQQIAPGFGGSVNQYPGGPIPGPVIDPLKCWYLADTPDAGVHRYIITITMQAPNYDPVTFQKQFRATIVRD